MPRLSVLSLRISFFWGLCGALLGAWVLAAKGSGAMHPLARSLHADLILYGWVIQTIFATAFWIFPRIRQERPRPGLAWAGFVIWNTGIVLDPAMIWWSAPGLGGILRLGAAALFVLHFLPRIRSVPG